METKGFKVTESKTKIIVFISKGAGKKIGWKRCEKEIEQVK